MGSYPGKTISSHAFDQGHAGSIFLRLRKRGIIVALKNNVPECVMLSPETYMKLIEELED